MAFDAFISYSHAADGKLAPALQRGLQQLAKPWTRRQALRIFRDDTGLSVNPALWQAIATALDESEYFILLASPGAAQSEWVNREINHWMASRPDAAARMLPVVTAGSWAWDEASGEIDWASSTAAPAALAGVFAGEPRHLDLAWAQSEDDLDLRNSRFRDAVADLAAPIHGIPKDELESEDVRQHRRALRLRRGAVAALVLLVIGLGVAGVLAQRAAETARGALRDLEDANGNIDQLTEEGAALEAANRQAADDLAATESARAEAEELADQARDEAAAADVARQAAVEARATAEDAQSRAEDARATAEQAQAAAEAARADAEAARADAEAARVGAEQDRDAAEQAAAEASQAEAAAEAAEAAARVAEAQAQANEQAALDAGEVARREEAEAREAQSVAQAGERVARAAEAAAVAAEEAAAAAEAVARAEEQEARAAEAAAEEAAAVAQARREEAEAAALSVSIARAAAEQSDPTLNALLSVESYCVLASCESGGIQSLRAVETATPALAQFVAEQLDPLVPMIESVSTHHDVIGPLLGWTGRAVDVAVSDDGRTVAALRADGTFDVWTEPGAPGERSTATDVVGIAVSDDGSAIAYVTSTPFTTTSGGPVGVIETISVQNLVDGGGIGGTLRSGEDAGAPSQHVDLSFQPGSNEIVLIDGGFELKVFDPSLETVEPNEFPDYRIPGSLAVWMPDGQLAFFDAGEGHIAERDGTGPVVEIGSVHGAVPTVAARAGNNIVVGYSDGALGVVKPTELYMVTSSVHLAAVEDVAVSGDGRAVVSSASDGSVRRTRLLAHAFGPSTEIVSSPQPVPLDAAAGAAADVLVMGIDQRLERRTASNSWAGAFARGEVTGPPATSGAVLTGNFEHGFEVVSPEGAIGVEEVDESAVLSADGSTLIVNAGRPRVGPVASFTSATALPLIADEVIDGPLAVSATGATVAAVVEESFFARSILVFDGRTLQRRATIPIRAAFNGAPFEVQIIGLLVSDTSLIVQRQQDDLTSFHRDDRIEVYRLDGTRTRSIPDRQNGSPMWQSPDAPGDLYVAAPTGLVTAYPLVGGDPTVVLDVGSRQTVTALAAGPPGSGLLVVGYASGLVELWNLTTGEFIVELSRHELPVTGAAIGETAAGLRVTTTAGARFIGSEAVVRTLSDPDVLRRSLCALSGRDLTAAEWRRFIEVGEPRPCARGLS